jgi:hypothetical protein
LYHPDESINNIGRYCKKTAADVEELEGRINKVLETTRQVNLVYSHKRAPQLCLIVNKDEFLMKAKTRPSMNMFTF